MPVRNGYCCRLSSVSRGSRVNSLSAAQFNHCKHMDGNPSSGIYHRLLVLGQSGMQNLPCWWWMRSQASLMFGLSCWVHDQGAAECQRSTAATTGFAGPTCTMQPSPSAVVRYVACTHHNLCLESKEERASTSSQPMCCGVSYAA